MGLDYVDLWLAHWPFASKPISKAALEKATVGPGKSAEEKGQLEENGKIVIDWEHTSENIANQTGELSRDLGVKRR